MWAWRFLFRSFYIKSSISLMLIGLFILSISCWLSFGSTWFSRNKVIRFMRMKLFVVFSYYLFNGCMIFCGMSFFNPDIRDSLNILIFVTEERLIHFVDFCKGLAFSFYINFLYWFPTLNLIDICSFFVSFLLLALSSFFSSFFWFLKVGM